MDTFATNLINIRKKMGISQSKLAKLSGLTSSAISQYESINRDPSIDALIKLSKTLNISIDELIGNNSNIMDMKDNFYKMLNYLNAIDDSISILGLYLDINSLIKTDAMLFLGQSKLFEAKDNNIILYNFLMSFPESPEYLQININKIKERLQILLDDKTKLQLAFWVTANKRLSLENGSSHLLMLYKNLIIKEFNINKRDEEFAIYPNITLILNDANWGNDVKLSKDS